MWNVIPIFASRLRKFIQNKPGAKCSLISCFTRLYTCLPISLIIFVIVLCWFSKTWGLKKSFVSGVCINLCAVNVAFYDVSRVVMIIIYCFSGSSFGSLEAGLPQESSSATTVPFAILTWTNWSPCLSGALKIRYERCGADDLRKCRSEEQSCSTKPNERQHSGDVHLVSAFCDVESRMYKRA